MNPTARILIALSILTSLSASSDQVLKTYPPGSAQEALEQADKDIKNPVGESGGTLVVIDQECADQTLKDRKMKSEKPNPEYEACVKAKMEAKKRSLSKPKSEKKNN